MLTLKQITEQTQAVIAGLDKKHFHNAEVVIGKVLELNEARKKAQAQLDKNLAESKKMAASIGSLMKAGNSAEIEKVKSEVAQLKESNKQLEESMTSAEKDIQAIQIGRAHV